MILVRHLLAHRRLAALLLAVTLAVKLLVPTGYMVVADHGRLAIMPCPGMTPPAAMADGAGMHGAMAAHHAMPDHGGGTGHGREGGKAELPCAFAGLSAAALGAIDAVQLAALIAFVLALGIAGIALPATGSPVWLRPPLRGPPILLRSRESAPA